MLSGDEGEEKGHVFQQGVESVVKFPHCPLAVWFRQKKIQEIRDWIPAGRPELFPNRAVQQLGTRPLSNLMPEDRHRRKLARPFHRGGKKDEGFNSR